MPTGAQFRSAATSLRELSSVARLAVSAIDALTLDTGLSGGSVADTVDTAVRASIVNAGTVETQAEILAGVMDERARACDIYTEEMRVYRAALASWRTDQATMPHVPRPAPDAPVRWADWIEEG